MPTQRELPVPMQPLARRNAVRVDHERFDQDVSQLLRELDEILTGASSRGRPVSADFSAGAGGARELAIVKTISEVRDLSRRGGLMLVTAKAERGMGAQLLERHFPKSAR
jgi:hypothetical protein